MSSVTASLGLNVSPYLTSALSRIQANEKAGALKAPAPAPAGANTQILSNQTLGALVAIQGGKP
ncbi:MAG TPA: hypothetical protein VFA87_12110 [Rhizomicrobium sp.]|nr:hypothetical protein [Rhizomicrobium sp.]